MWDHSGEARIGRRDSSLRLSMLIARLYTTSCMMGLSSQGRIDGLEYQRRIDRADTCILDNDVVLKAGSFGLLVQHLVYWLINNAYESAASDKAVC